ncbi:MAG: universal stress protein [Burkholderiales bacterium]|nr:universal stress protein [Burkholderiales bacterium]
MSRIAHIVAATDFSPAAEHAVQRAALIAMQLNAKLHLLHVVHPLSLYPGLELEPDALMRHEQTLREASGNRLDALVAMLHDHFGLQPHAATRIGRAHAQISSYAQSVSADLVVCGARGENTLLDLVLGSTASRLLRIADCPVLVVKNKGIAPYRQALVAVDFSPNSADVFATALAIAPGARVEALHVYDTTIEEQMRQAGLDEATITDFRVRATAEMERRLDALVAGPSGDGPVTRHRMAGYPAAAICERIVALPADLVVLGRYGRSGMQELLLGSVSKDVAGATDCDVLVVAPPRGLQAESGK